MGRSAVVEHEDRFSETTPLLDSDERWQVAKRAVASRHFARSPLLSNFLLYIVAETIQGRSDQITEHEIGVHVFERPAHYRTLEDNIVRSYARQLRRRLTDYFLQEGSSERLHIEIPLGGYIPIFVNAGEEGSQEAESVALDQNGSPHSPPAISRPLGSNIGQSRWTWRRSLILLGLETAKPTSASFITMAWAQRRSSTRIPCPAKCPNTSATGTNPRTKPSLLSLSCRV